VEAVEMETTDIRGQ